jgi:hypothetical protein
VEVATIAGNTHHKEFALENDGVDQGRAAGLAKSAVLK